MKSFAAVAAVAAVAALVAADTCDYSVVGPTLQGLADPIADCMSATGYNIANYTVSATAEQKSAVCSDCSSLIDALNELTWPDCTMELAGENQTLTEYFANIIGDCDTAGSQYTSVSSTTASSTTGSTTTVGSGSSADATVTTTAPSTSSSSGTASSTGGAVSVTLSAAAVLVAAVASAIAY